MIDVGALGKYRPFLKVVPSGYAADVDWDSVAGGLPALGAALGEAEGDLRLLLGGREIP